MTSISDRSFHNCFAPALKPRLNDNLDFYSFPMHRKRQWHRNEGIEGDTLLTVEENILLLQHPPNSLWSERGNGNRRGLNRISAGPGYWIALFTLCSHSLIFQTSRCRICILEVVSFTLVDIFNTPCMQVITSFHACFDISLMKSGQEVKMNGQTEYGIEWGWLESYALVESEVSHNQYF